MIQTDTNPFYKLQKKLNIESSMAKREWDRKKKSAEKRKYESEKALAKPTETLWKIFSGMNSMSVEEMQKMQKEKPWALWEIMMTFREIVRAIKAMRENITAHRDLTEANAQIKHCEANMWRWE